MIFKPELVAKILAGEKTMTRRPIKQGEVRCRYQPGRSYALQSGRGKKAKHRIVITQVHREELADISEEDARAEGFTSAQEFFAYWRQLYGTGPLIRIPVWVISFVLEQRESVRYLRPKSGYVEQPGGAVNPPQGAMGGEPGGEPAAIDEETQERFTAEAWERYAQRQPHRSLENRLKVVRAEAREKGIDASRLEASLERRIAAYERLVRSEMAA